MLPPSAPFALALVRCIASALSTAALHPACYRPFTPQAGRRATEIVSLLLQHGADPTAVDVLGLTPLDLAGKDEQETGWLHLLTQELESAVTQTNEAEAGSSPP